jgi:Flp pilus assembly protein TadG
MRTIYEMTEKTVVMKRTVGPKPPTSCRRPRHYRESPRFAGSTLVEFALILPLLLLLSLCVIQYGLILNTTISLSHLTREGARYAAVAPTTDLGIKDRIRDVTPAPLKYSDLHVYIAPMEGSDQRVSPNPITVTITYDMSKKVFLPRRFFGVQIFASTFTTKASAMIE